MTQLEMLTMVSFQGCIPLVVACQGIVARHHSLMPCIAIHIYLVERFCEVPQVHQNRHSLWQTLSLHPECEIIKTWLHEFSLRFSSGKQHQFASKRWMGRTQRSNGIIEVHQVHPLWYMHDETYDDPGNEYATLKVQITLDQDDQSENDCVTTVFLWAPTWCRFWQPKLMNYQ